MKNSFLLPAFLLFLTISAQAETFYVHNLNGSDQNSGLRADQPFATLTKGVSCLKPGDRLILADSGTPYFESLALRNVSGTADQPIEVDGSGAVLDGSRPLLPESWTPLGNDLYSQPMKMSDSLKLRFFLLFDGQINRMGNSLKGHRVQFKPVNQLGPSEWTWIESEQMLYVRLPQGQSLADAKISCPDFQRWESGVKLSGSCHHLIIRNVTTTHFFNDGFNLHGDCTEISFFNVRALFNGDDGISAHEACSFLLDGFFSEGCGTGICHIQEAVGVHKNCVLKNAAGIEIALYGDTTNVLENVCVESTAMLGVIVDCRSCKIQNCRIHYVGEKKETILKAKEELEGSFEIQ